MAVTMKIREEHAQELEQALRDIPGGIEKAFARASMRVAKQGVTLISADITGRVNIKKKDLKKVLRAKKRGNTSAMSELDKSGRFPLKYFGAKQAKKGVTYKIEKSGKRSLALSAFGPEIPRLGRHVFKRASPVEVPPKYKGRNKGKKKRHDNLPIIPLFGVSPWGTFVRNKMLEPTKLKLQIAFERRIESEARYLIDQHLKKTGGTENATN
jgi:hypothetical protein